MVWHGRLGKVCRGELGQVTARPGVACYGKVRLCQIRMIFGVNDLRRGRLGMVRSGLLRFGKVCSGMARQVG